MTRPITEHESYDAVVVGARCAGAATAMLLAAAASSARHRPPALRERHPLHPRPDARRRAPAPPLGVLGALEAAGTPAIRRTSFHYGDDELVVPITPRDGVDALYAPRRTVLDAALVDAAATPAPRSCTGSASPIWSATTAAGCAASSSSAPTGDGADRLRNRDRCRRPALHRRPPGGRRGRARGPARVRRRLRLLDGHRARAHALVLPGGVGVGAIPTNGGARASLPAPRPRASGTRSGPTSPPGTGGCSRSAHRRWLPS